MPEPRAMPGAEMDMSPLHTSLSLFAPSTRADVPLATVMFTHQFMVPSGFEFGGASSVPLKMAASRKFGE